MSSNDLPDEDIKAALADVNERCDGRGYELVQVASGYRFQVRQNSSHLGGAVMARATSTVLASTPRDLIAYCLPTADYPG